nr:hypothetical protein [Candidatus Palauibacterales bacterium]
MTARAWLIAEAHRARRLALAATGLALIAPIGAALLAGVLLDVLGAFGRYPELVLAPWLTAAGAAGLVVWRRRRAIRAASALGVGARAERLGGLRSGELAGLADDTHGSAALAALADRRMQSWLDAHGQTLAHALRRDRWRGMSLHAVTAGAGFLLLAATGALRPDSAVWRPVASVRAARAPVRLTVDRTAATRGDSVTVAIDAPGRETAVLHLRRAGETWSAEPLALTGGRAATVVGPIVADLELVAESGRRRSDTVRVALRPSLFLAELAVTAHYPPYLERPDEPVLLLGDTVLLPVGTVLETRARASLPLIAAAWRAPDHRIPLEVDGATVRGDLPVQRSATWELALQAEDSIPLEEGPPTLTVVAVPDAAPTVMLIVPAADTVMPTTLLQALVIETQDDHRVTRMEVRSRRVSRLGTAGDAVVEPVALPPDGLERGVLAAQLDLNGRGFLPGDTAYVAVRVLDNAPRPRSAETAEIRLRLPSLAELRQAARDETHDLAASADSLAGAQQAVERAVEDLARERIRSESGGQGEGRSAMEFTQAERAGTLGKEQREVLER